MKAQSILFFLVLTLLISGCDVVQTHKFRSYITEYYDYQNFDLQITDEGNIEIQGLYQKWLYGWESTGSKKKLYDSLCILHNDVSYNKKRDYIAGPDWGYSYKGDFTSIDVISNTDFDMQHPANSSLNDIIHFMSISLYPYILSDYKNTFDWEHNLPESFKCEGRFRRQENQLEASCYHPIDKKLSELTASDMILVGSYGTTGFLVFERQPTIASEHKLTVTIKVSDGRVFTPSVTKVFE